MPLAHRLLFLLLGWCSAWGTCLARPAVVPPKLEEAPAVLLARGAEAFARQDFSAACAAWEEVRPQLAAEAAAVDKLLPLLGFSAVRAGQAPLAVRTLEEWLRGSAPASDPRRPFARLCLAEARLASGDAAAAIRELERFLADHAADRRAALVQLRKARWLREAGKVGEADATLAALTPDTAGYALAAEALAERLELALAGTDAAILGLAAKRVADLFRNPPHATVGAVALQAHRLLAEAADRLVAEGREAEALELYRALPGKKALARVLSEAATALEPIRRAPGPGMAGGLGAEAGQGTPPTEAGLARARETPGRGPAPAGASYAAQLAPEQAWAAYHEELARRVRLALLRLAEAPDPGPALRLRLARVLLALHRPREAWLLAEQVAGDTKAATELRDAAHVCWTLATLACSAWDEALALVRAHAAAHPGSARHRELLHLGALACSGAGRHAEAVEMLGTLLADAPDAFDAARTRLARGRSLLHLRQFDRAKEDFASLRDSGPDPTWRFRGAEWLVITRGLAREHGEALLECERALKAGPPGSLYPDIEYRRILALRALARNAEASDACGHWLTRHRGHARELELTVLAGDLALGAGELRKAIALFATISAENPAARGYAVFQSCKALRGLEDWAGLEKLCGAYALEAAPENSRIAEALHWQAEALRKLGREAEASAVWATALERHGDNPAATGIDAVLRRVLAPRQTSGTSGVAAWLDDARDRALRDGRLTLYARLTLAAADREERAGRGGLASALRNDVAVRVPAERLDARGLLAAARALEEVDAAAARSRLERLLELHGREPPALDAEVMLARLDGAAGLVFEARRRLTLVQERLPGHPRLWLARLALATLQLAAKESAAARSGAEFVLAQKGARGRPHAEALLLLAECHQLENHSEEALACFQRVYALHLAQHDLAAKAYLSAASLLADSGRSSAAHETLDELERTAPLARENWHEAVVLLRQRLPAKTAAKVVASSGTASVTPKPL